MACTIVSTPALGASDWSAFITQVTGLKRGFMNLSYTNFAASAASAIATGGVIEVAGSFYVFSETAIDYSTTTSANADLYIYAQPSAGGTTCTVVALTAAPAWRDDYQGFYASAASLNRAIGGMYVGTAVTYYNRFIYDDYITSLCRVSNATRPILQKKIDLGEWNMDTTQTIVPNLGQIHPSKTLDFVGVIVDDSLNRYSMTFPLDTIGSANHMFIALTAAVTLNRGTNGSYDNTTYNGTASTVPSRGYVIVTYEA